VGDRQLVAGLENSGLDPHAIDPGAVGAAQVAHDHLSGVDREAAMPPGNARRIKADVATAMTADNDEDPIDCDIRLTME
jgi:hypothetical protein